MSLIHGGDVEGYKREYGHSPLDFSANISPLGLPDGVKKAIISALEEADRYPDPLCRNLTDTIAQTENVPSAYVLCGNGAADLIYRLVLAKKPKTALIPVPSFAEYEKALKLTGCEIRYHFLKPENEFQLNETILSDLTPQTDLLFLCNPNNPTGQVVSPGLLNDILDRCLEFGITVLLDECFQEFLEPSMGGSQKDSLKSRPNLVILKAFTKTFAMAGIRLGYLLTSDFKLLEECRAAGQPWAVSSLAQAAGMAALNETDYLKKLKQLICQERIWMKKELSQMGIPIIGSHANYLFFYSPAEGLPHLLKNEGILIRSCDNYIGLEPGYCRVAIKTHPENKRLLAAMWRLLKGENR